MPEELYLRKNTASWDRALRLAAAAAIVLGLPLVVRNPFGLLAGGVIAGFLLFAFLTGY